jgi:hypothetical protein
LRNGGHAKNGGAVARQAVGGSFVGRDGVRFAFDTCVDVALGRERSQATRTTHGTGFNRVNVVKIFKCGHVDVGESVDARYDGHFDVVGRGCYIRCGVQSFPPYESGLDETFGAK